MLGGNEALQRALQGAAGGSVQLGSAELESLQQMLQQAGVASGGGTGSQQVQFVVLDSDGQQQTCSCRWGQWGGAGFGGVYTTPNRDARHYAVRVTKYNWMLYGLRLVPWDGLPLYGFTVYDRIKPYAHIFLN
jgi:hypothetical protein